MSEKARGRRKARKTGTAPRVDREKQTHLAAVLKPLLAPRHRKRVAAGTRLALALSRDERNLVLHNWSVSFGLTDEQLQDLKKAEKPELRLTLAEWEDFGGWVAGTANHARSGSRLRSRADRFSDRIQELLDSYKEE
ncbi:MAG: hypothetical protein JSU73_11865 [candidate division WOR-3 bacterium]|nr:MAG: hypothetical protein JSU73_11865 [candidate division WOR-3 bacterium]